MHRDAAACLFVLYTFSFTLGARENEPLGMHLRAAQWHNLQTLELSVGPRTYLLYLFSTRLAGDPPVDLVAALNRLDQRPDVVVYGLSPDSPERVAKYIEQSRIRFAVGSGAQKLRGFGVTAWPAVFAVHASCDAEDEPPRQIDATVAVLRGFERRLATARAESREDKQPTSSPTTTQEQVELAGETKTLKQAALSDDDSGVRRRAITRLSEIMEPRAFVAFCDEVLAAPPPAKSNRNWWLRGYWYTDVAHAQQLANPDVTKERPLVTFFDLARMQKGADAVDLAAAEGIKAGLPTKSVDEIRDLYLEHLTNLPVELLIRGAIRDYFEERPFSCTECRQFVAEVYPYEPDSALRNNLVSALAELCPPGDEGAIGIARQIAENDPDFPKVGCMAREVLYYLMTGDAGSDLPERYRNRKPGQSAAEAAVAMDKGD